MVDLTKIEGLTEAQASALAELFDSETSGLKSKVDELLSEKKSVSAKATELEQIAADARKAAEAAAEERMKAANDMEGLKKLYEKQRADDAALYKSEAEKHKSMLESYHKESFINQAKSLVHEDFRDLSSAMFEKLVHLEYDDKQQVRPVFKNGDDVIATNLDEFRSWAAEQPSWKRVLNGVDSSGAGVTSSKSGGASFSGKSYSEMTLQEQVAYNKSKQ